MNTADEDNKIKGVIVILTLSIATYIGCLTLKTVNVLFVANLILMMLILIQSKFSYFSIKAILINYILLPVFFQFNTGESYGILESTKMPLHYSQINFLIYIYNAITYIWVNFSSILKNESELLNKEYSISNASTYFCCFIAVLTTIIAFPTLPFSSEYINNRFVGLLQGNAWNHVAIVSLIFILPNFKKNNVVKITYLFVIFWFISHYERVDIIGLLVLSFIYILSRRKKMKFKNYIIGGIIGILVIFTMIYIGEARVNNTQNIQITNLIKKTLVQNTASDLGYVFNSSIEYYKNEDLLLGKTYFTYIMKLIPLVGNDMSAGIVLQNMYKTPGGEFILSEPLMNFGILGIIIFQIIEFMIYTIILNKNSKYRFFVYAFLIATVFRTTWYGWLYIEKGVVYFIPIIYGISKIIDGWSIKKHSNGGTNGPENKSIDV